MRASKGMPGAKPQSAYQFAIFRWLLGLYLAVHLASLVRWGPELFSHQGVVPDPAVSPLHGLFPNVLAWIDSPLAVQGFLGLLCLAALLLAAGRWRPAMAVLLWYGWTCLFDRNVLISNPGLPYVGLVLVLCALVPPGEGLRVGRFRARDGWRMPLWLWRAAFLSLMAGYTYSGLMKLTAPSWIHGEALEMLLTNPLARDWFARDLLILVPQPLLQGLTWIALVGEIAALPLCLVRRGRFVAWAWMLAMHLGIVLVVDFADLTLAMILVHLFVFDPEWLPASPSDRQRIIFFDGVCALCDASMRFLIGEDRARILRYAPLQGETAALEPRVASLLDGDDAELKSVIYLRGAGDEKEVLTRSDAILAICDDLGGLWRVFGLARWVPRALRDRVYDWIGRNRYQWFGRMEACRLPGEGEAELFLE